jgi:glycosyltransferase involved in cell wall biosynthesis
MEPVEAARVVGLLSSATGIGKSARLCARALSLDGIAVSTANVSDAFAADDGIPYLGQGVRGRAEAKVSIYHLNPPKLLVGLIRSGFGRYRRSFNIGYWAWELETLPPEWVDVLRFVDAVMVPSFFCRDTVARYTSKPVLVVPHPVHLEAPAPSTAGKSRTFCVLNIFSFDSSFERKNPVGLVRAFKRAFGGDPNVALILKATGGTRYPAQLRELLSEIGGAPNIALKDEVWTTAQLEAALASAHVYASLHRSEGFGLTLAEAALAGVPLVVTNWSGNADFCSPDECYPVDYELTPVRDNHPDLAGATGARWAEPSVERAAAQLSAVRASPAAACNKATALRATLLRHLEGSTYSAALAELVAMKALLGTRAA